MATILGTEPVQARRQTEVRGRVVEAGSGGERHGEHEKDDERAHGDERMCSVRADAEPTDVARSRARVGSCAHVRAHAARIAAHA